MFPKFEIVPVHVQERNLWQVIVWFSETYAMAQPGFFESEIDAKITIDQWNNQANKDNKTYHINQPHIHYNPKYLQ